MKITDLKQNEGILCPTEKIFKKICKLNKTNEVEIYDVFYKKNIIYYPFNRDKKGSFSDLRFAEEQGRKIYKASKFLKPTLKSKVNKLEILVDVLMGLAPKENKALILKCKDLLS